MRRGLIGESYVAFLYLRTEGDRGIARFAMCSKSWSLPFVVVAVWSGLPVPYFTRIGDWSLGEPCIGEKLSVSICLAVYCILILFIITYY